MEEDFGYSDRDEVREKPAFFLGESLGREHRENVERIQRGLTDISNEISAVLSELKDNEWDGRLYRRLVKTYEQFDKDSKKLSKEWQKALERADRKEIY